MSVEGLVELSRKAWALHQRMAALAEVPLVRPSIPILYFGDAERYERSSLRVITVGLNPSRTEFPDDDRFRRFPAARDETPSAWPSDRRDGYLQSLNEYFRTSPYDGWFRVSFEPLLNGMGASYYGEAESTALHTDLCSPLATDPTWTHLPTPIRAQLAPDGVALWHELVEILKPDVVLTSVARSHMEKVRFQRIGSWQVVYTVERRNPFTVEGTSIVIPPASKALLIFGRASQTPFGSVSAADKVRIGEAIRAWHASG